MLAATIVTGLYYRKFLSRADMHVAHSMAPAVPLLFYAVDRVLTAISEQVVIRWRTWLHPLGATAILLYVGASAPRGPVASLTTLKGRLQVGVPEQPVLERMGWSDKASVAPLAAQVASLEAFLAGVLGPEDSIFDFTNQPALYHFLLDLKPASRFFHVSMAIRARTQAEVIADLKRSRPPLVVYESDFGGLPEWDGVNNVVRHHEISRYLLANYRPLGAVAGQTFYVRNGVDLSPAKAAPRSVELLPPRSGVESEQQCDWGFSPAFLEAEPMTTGPLCVRKASRIAMRVEARGWAIRRDLKGPAKEVVATAGGRIVGRTAISLARPDISNAFGPGLDGSGFHLVSEWVGDQAPTDSPLAVRLFVLTESGEAQELLVPWRHGANSDLAPDQAPAGSRVVREAVSANVDSAEISRELVTECVFPPEVAAETLAGLELSVMAQHAGAIAISTSAPGDEGRALARASRPIVFRVQRYQRPESSE